MDSITTLTHIPTDAIISFQNAQELDTYTALSVVQCGHSREKILDLFQNFVWSLDGKRAALCTSTWTSNHADWNSPDLNVVKIQRDDFVIGIATRDIAEGEELLNDYMKFNIPSFYQHYCDQHGIRDVRSAVMQAITGTNHPCNPSTS